MRTASLDVPRFGALALVLAVAGCGEGAPTAPGDLPLPAKFLFGTATAGFQIELGCPTVEGARCEDRNSDWYQWVTKPELVAATETHVNAEPPTDGPGFYELYAADLDRAASELHSNSLRISIEWSRLFPVATDGVSGHDALRKLASADALAYYHALFAAMKARSIRPLVTLNHYTLPSWIHDAYGCHVDLAHCSPRGWLDHDRILAEISKYAGFAAEEFGGEVDDWATLNEPFTGVAFAGYLGPSAQRTNPPGVFLKGPEGKAVTLALIEAHARMYDAVKAGDTVDADGDGKTSSVGLVYNCQATAPANKDEPLDVQGAKNLEYLMQQVFLDGVIKGDVDADFNGTTVHRADLAGKMDFLGINYYARATVMGARRSFLPQLSSLLTFNILALALDWDAADGIHEVLAWATDRYHLPIIITETGHWDPTDDGTSAAWVVRTLSWISRSVAEGVDVRGYYYWSLMDNWEWNHGMTVKMGLYAVDPKDPTKARKPRSGVAAYGRIAAAGAVPADLAARYPIK